MLITHVLCEGYTSEAKHNTQLTLMHGDGRSSFVISEQMKHFHSLIKKSYFSIRIP